MSESSNTNPPGNSHLDDLPPLHHAARIGDCAAIRRLVDKGADVNTTFDVGRHLEAYPRIMTPLMTAAGSEDGADVETVRTLLELGADPVLVVDEQTAASHACHGSLEWAYRAGGDASRLQLLLESGSPLPPDPYLRNQMLCRTASVGDAQRLSVLLVGRIGPGGYFNPEESVQRAKLAQEYMKQWDFVEHEEDRVWASQVEDEANREELKRAACGPLPHEIPLHCAAAEGHADCLKMLLDAGADPLARDYCQRTALYDAANSVTVRILVAAGVPVEDTDSLGWSPLVNGVSDGDIERIRALIDAGADVNETHDRGYTVFMSAVSSMKRSLDVLKLLIKVGADPHAVTERGWNAFHAGVDVDGEANEEQSVRETLCYLKELGIDLERRNKLEHTPLAKALMEGTSIEVQVLCDLGADVNAVCPMHQCGKEQCSCIDLPLLFHAAVGIGVDSDDKTAVLLKAGADPFVTDEQGCTPLMHVAVRMTKALDDSRACYQSLLNGLLALPLPDESLVRRPDKYILKIQCDAGKYLREFADSIPIRSTSEYAAEWRSEQLKCLEFLFAYECLVRANGTGSHNIGP
ncbi:MAG: hypothetical protein D8M59_15680 [Planctomycetes bacterium]|nr:hypothetical protein [Planctomycetota bacterium]NOG54901.1 hypothetical protein [Planctomycetota bacterium]